MMIAWFDALDLAEAHRAARGGWLFDVADSDIVVWFDAACFTPSAILERPVAQGFGGALR